MQRLIDADALHSEISKWPDSVMYKDWVQSAIATAPTVPSDVQPVRHGRWITEDEYYVDDTDIPKDLQGRVKWYFGQEVKNDGTISE